MKRLGLVISGGIAVILTACQGVGIYNPQATETSLEATVGALQGTIVALETAQAGAQPPASPTPTLAMETPTASPTKPPPTPTPTTFPSPTASPTSGRAKTSSSETVVVTATPTQTPTPEPTSGAYDVLPILLEPGDGVIIEEGRQILLKWAWPGSLGPNEYFDIKFKPDGQDESAHIIWEKDQEHEFTANLPPGRYYWSVQVLKGSYKNGEAKPENRQFEAFLGPESEPRLIVIGKRAPSLPASVSQADPPAPGLLYGLMLGGISFMAFVSVSRPRG